MNGPNAQKAEWSVFGNLSSDVLSAIIEFQREITTAGFDLQAVLHMTATKMQEWLRGDGATIEMFHGEYLIVRHATGTAEPVQGMRFQLKGTSSSICLESGEVIRIDDSETDQRVNRVITQKASARSMILSPLVNNGVRVGVLKVISKKIGNFTPLDEKILELTAGFLAAAMANAQQMISSAIETTRIGTWELDLAAEKAALSESARTIWGLDPHRATFHPRETGELIHPDDSARVTELIQSLSLDDPEFEVDYRILRPDGDQLWVVVRGRCFFDAFGKVVKLAGTIADITKRKTAELKLEENELRLRIALQAGHLGSWAVDLKTMELTCNDRCKANCGVAPDSTLTYEDLLKKIHDEDRPRMQAAVLHAIETRSRYVCEYRLRWDDGSIHWIEASGDVAHNVAGEPTRLVGITANITDRKNAEIELREAKEAAEAASRMKSSFLANMSHEIRTPLGAILGFGQLMKDPEMDDIDLRSFADVILRNGDQLQMIINDILDLSKIESGFLRTEMAPCSPRQLVLDVVSLLSVHANKKGLRINYTIDPGTRDELVTDPFRFKQILTNVVSNAIKFTERGFVRIRLYDQTVKETGTRHVAVDVTDSGIGMSREESGRLFEDFRQADDSIARRFGGTGLGLALSRKIANLLGGNVELLASQPGFGSTFRILVKSETLPENLETSASTPAPSKRRSLENLKVLLVEDAPDNQLLIQRFLRKQSIDVDLAANGAEGVEKALRGDFDLVLMDVQMPIMDGYTATKRLRALGFRKPIIALTAHAMSEVRQYSLNAGCTDYLSKPIVFDELLEKLARYSFVE